MLKKIGFDTHDLGKYEGLIELQNTKSALQKLA